EDLKTKIIGMNAHAVVLSHVGTFPPDSQVEKEIRDTPGVTGITPFTYNELLIQQGSQTEGLILKGADPKTLGEVTDLVGDVCLQDETGGPKDKNECGKHRGERMAERQSLLETIDQEHV